MKNIYKFLALLTMIFTLGSCENEDNFLILEAPEAAFTILTPESGSSIILNKEVASNTAATFSWEKVNYGTPTVVTYTLQFAKVNTDFLVPVDVTSSTTTFTSVSVENLNAQALALGLEAGKKGTIEVRIKSSVGSTASEAKYSNVITLSVTPYTVAEPTVDLYIVGDATPYKWNAEVPLTRDLTNSKIFYYAGWFDKGEFKFDTAIGGWKNMYGFDGTAVVKGDGSIGNFKITTAGYYNFKINIGDLTYSLTPIATTPTSYTTLNTKGTSFAGAWDSDNVMTRTKESHIWKISINVLKGEFLFHADNWTKKWGLDGTTSNIPTTTTGKFDIWFNDIDGRYIFISAQ